MVPGRWAAMTQVLADMVAFRHVIVLRSAEFLGESDVAEPIRVFILDDFTNELRAVIAEPCKHLVDVVHGEHHAEVTQSVSGVLR